MWTLLTSSPLAAAWNRWRTAIAMLWFAAIAAASFMPFRWKLRIGTHGSAHLPLHFAVFFLSEWVVAAPRRSLRRQLAFALMVILYGCLLECLEALCFGNPLEWQDILADSAGVLAALLLVLALFRPQEYRITKRT